MAEETYKRFADLSFDDFRDMANDKSLSCCEKIGFPDSYRKGREQAIFNDIQLKIPVLNEQGKTVLDIGPGCSELPQIISKLCKAHNHQLVLVDSDEMLDLLPDDTFIKKIAAYYPQCPQLFSDYSGRIDVIICYSVFHYIFTESSVWTFLDKSLELLAEGGSLLIGDIPNISMRRRFFSSDAGKRFHRNFTGENDDPDVTFNTLVTKSIDDSVIFSLLMRARDAGFDAYVLPQSSDLPMANRREDILIKRP